MSERGDSGHIISPLPSALGAAALNPGLSEQLFAHEISRSPELRRAAADRVGACERVLAVWPPSLRALAVSPPSFPFSFRSALLLKFRAEDAKKMARRRVPRCPES